MLNCVRNGPLGFIFLSTRQFSPNALYVMRYRTHRRGRLVIRKRPESGSGLGVGGEFPIKRQSGSGTQSDDAAANRDGQATLEHVKMRRRVARASCHRASDGRDEFRGRTFGTGFAAMRRRRKEQAVFAIHQRLVEFKERCRLDERAKFRNRRGLMNSVVRPSTKRSIEVRFGARCRERLLMSNWCFSTRDSAATARTPSGRTSFAKVASRRMTRMRS